MKFTKEIKKIIALLDDTREQDFFQLISQYVELSKAKKILQKLLKEKLIEIFYIDDQKLYLHTSKIQKHMVDQDIAKEFNTPAYHKFFTLPSLVHKYKNIDLLEHLRS